MKSATNTPNKESELILLITVGKLIQLKWVVMALYITQDISIPSPQCIGIDHVKLTSIS